MRLAIALGANYAPTTSAPAWTPTDLGAGLLAWYKADSIAQADNTAVTSWADSSGNGWTATEATNTPTLQTNELNGLPVVRFDATNDILTTSSVTHGIGTGNFAFCFVYKAATLATGFHRIQMINLSSATMFGVSIDVGGIKGEIFADGDRIFDNLLTAGTWYTLLYERVGTALSLYINGTLDADVGQASSKNVANGVFRFGSDTSSQALGTDLAEAINYKGTLSAGDRTSLLAYLRTKYAHY